MANENIQKIAEELNEANTQMLRLMKKLHTAQKSETPDIMNALAEQIAMKGRFISVIRLTGGEPTLGADGIAVLPKGTRIEFAMLEDNAGKKFYPVFTTGEELQKWPGMGQNNPRTMIVGFDDIARMVLDQKGAEGFVINPFSDNLLIKGEACLRWRQKKQFQTNGFAENKLSADQKIDFNDYEALPLALVSALVGAAKKNANVKTMWLRQMTVDGKKSHVLIGEFTGNFGETCSALGAAAKEFIGDMDLNMLNAADKLGKKAVEGVEPIYRA